MTTVVVGQVHAFFLEELLLTDPGTNGDSIRQLHRRAAATATVIFPP